MRRALAGSTLTIILLLVSACSINKPMPVPYYSVPVDMKATDKEDMSWWAYRFRVAWPEHGDEADFAVDLLLAHAVVRPVLRKHSGKLLWWRFHRRAAREAPGHQFSFLFYADRETATEIISDLNGNVTLAAAKQEGIIKETVSSTTNEASKPDVASYSDPSWSPELQEAWPSFIMGASAFWLALIDEIKAEQATAEEANAEVADAADAINTLLEEYRLVDEKIAEIWQKEGQHALFHHLSAIFGYKPMTLKKEVVY